MNSVNFKTEKTYTKTFIKTFLFTFFYFAQVKVHAADWMIDLSRRQTDFNRIENQRMPSSNVEESANPNADKELFQAIKKIVNPVQPSQEIVIIQTETGFVPEKIYLKKNEIYKIHIVNLNSKEKNVSFLMDAFSQVHNTVFGVVKTFTIQPKVEGVYSYQSPETGALGKAVIISDSPNRKIASEKSSTK